MSFQPTFFLVLFRVSIFPFFYIFNFGKLETLSKLQLPSNERKRQKKQTYIRTCFAVLSPVLVFRFPISGNKNLLLKTTLSVGLLCPFVHLLRMERRRGNVQPRQRQRPQQNLAGARAIIVEQHEHQRH